MLPLNTTTPPQNKDDLVSLLVHATGQWLRLPKSGYPFKLEGEWPSLARFEVDLDGAAADPNTRMPVPYLQGTPSLAFVAGEFHLHAKPLRVASTSLQVDVQAQNMTFEYRTDARGQYWLVPAEEQAGHGGRAQISVRQDQLGDLFLSIAAPLAKPYGVTIEDAKVALEQVGPRSLKMVVDATGKKYVMRARLSVRGRLDIDDELNARLSELQAGGEGFVGGIVSNMLEPRLNKLNGASFPLAGMGLGSLDLRDLQLNVGPDVTLQATFGKA